MNSSVFFVKFSMCMKSKPMAQVSPRNEHGFSRALGVMAEKGMATLSE